MFKRDVFRDMKGVLSDDALGDADEFGVSTVIEEQVVTEIFL